MSEKPTRIGGEEPEDNGAEEENEGDEMNGVFGRSETGLVLLTGVGGRAVVVVVVVVHRKIYVAGDISGRRRR